MFYLLSFYTGILECGWIFCGVHLGLPVWVNLLFVAAYHLGNLFPLPFTLSKRVMYIVDFAIIAIAGSSRFLVETSAVAVALQGGGIFLCSLLVQSVRSGMKSDGNRIMKRVCRVAGFIAAPAAIIAPNAILATGAILALIALRKAPEICAKVTKPGLQSGFSLVMLFHQLHYFFYAHITLALAATLFGNLASTFFALTWVTYLSVEPLIKPLGKPVPTFFLGHLLIAVMLTMLGLSEINGAVIPFVILWVLAGFGGGTVFAISDITKQSGCYDKSSETIAENLGHVLGACSAALCAFFATEQAPVIMVFAAVFSAVCTITAMIFVRRRTNADQHNNR